MAIKWVSPSVVSVYIYLQPLFATILTLALTVERLMIEQIVAAILIGVAVYLVSFNKEKVVRSGKELDIEN